MGADSLTAYYTTYPGSKCVMTHALHICVYLQETHRLYYGTGLHSPLFMVLQILFEKQ